MIRAADPAEHGPLRSILIVGGGSAGWMTAAALASTLSQGCAITLVESEEIGTVGVGEATIPPIRTFNAMLGIDEREFIRSTQASFKLGIEFVGWGNTDSRYFHPFGPHGKPCDIRDVHQLWLQADDGSRFDDHSMAWHLAKTNRFAPPINDPRNVLSTFDYAFHFDAGRYARFLRNHSEQRGVTRVEGKVREVVRDGETGNVAHIVLQDGQILAADLFIDCTGFRALLMEGALGTGYEDWSHWLPCDRAIAIPCSNGGDFTPYTRSTAHSAGWQWRIPLQHRIGNGHVYSSAFMDDDRALEVLLGNLDGEPLAAPNHLKFTTGMRRKFWDHNVIAIGLSSGFMEPLESTSLHLIQAGISKLLALFPDRGFDPMVRDEYNHIARTEFERIRDFLILHYKLNTRPEPFWAYCRTMDIPDSLAFKIEHFRRFGRHIARDMDLFGPPSWHAVHIGQGNAPATFNPIGNYRPDDGSEWLGKLRAAMAAEAAKLPTHREFIDRHCRAPAA